ncbi:hypothetical protein ACFE04_006451 [Oxalis oulophora]
MNSFSNQEDCTLIDLMDIDQEQEEDTFLAFVEYARSELSPSPDETNPVVVEGDDPNTNDSGPRWSWIVKRILKTCISYSSGVTAAILLSDLDQAWSEQRNKALGLGGPTKKWINQLMVKKHGNRSSQRSKFPNTVTIDSIYEKNFLPFNCVIEAVVVDVFVLPGTNVYMLTLGDFCSSNTIDFYLQHRYYDLVSPQNGCLKKGREIYLTGCYLRTAREGCGSPRLLSEYVVILLDEDDDEMLLATFYFDSFSGISLDDVNQGVTYSLCGRVESIDLVETEVINSGTVQGKEIAIVDGDGVRLKFFLWGEQGRLLANLCSVGCILALEKPKIVCSAQSWIETNDEFILELASATQLFVVPSIQKEEQVCISLTQNQYGGSKPLSASCVSQLTKVSQVTLPCDSRGSIDFSNYPFRSLIVDLRDKMTGISLYAVVAEIYRENDTAEVIFNVRLSDKTGVISAKLHFSRSWSLGRLGIGHIVFISGLTCSITKQKSLELLLFEMDVGASFTNLSCLPSLLNSSCLHKLSCLSDLSGQTSKSLKVCRVWLDQVNHCHVETRFSHSVCGHFVEEKPGGIAECSFCCCDCNSEIVRAFHLKITLSDSSAKVFAWCTGQTASELLQITPDEFVELPEEEQVIYPSSLENEKFIVTLVNAEQQQGFTSTALSWEIACALKV